MARHDDSDGKTVLDDVQIVSVRDVRHSSLALRGADECVRPYTSEEYADTSSTPQASEQPGKFLSDSAGCTCDEDSGHELILDRVAPDAFVRGGAHGAP